MKNQDDFLIAHVELAKARFTTGEDLGIEFKNSIDAWTKIQVHHRHQIRNPRKRSLKGKQDLQTLTYSFRQKIEF